MKEIQLVLTNKLGLHARPAAAFVQTAAGFKSQISISTGEKQRMPKAFLVS